MQSSNVSATPTASIATSAPRPPVSSFTAATAILVPVVDRRVCAELARLREAPRIEVDRDDAAGREQLRGHDRGEADRARADDRDRVARADPAVQDADLVRRGQDVREEQHLLVGERLRHLVHGRVGERHARELCLEPVDEVAEDPAASAGAKAVVALAAEAAAAARRDAGHEHAVALVQRRDAAARLDDGADGLVAEDGPWLHLGDVALEDVQVGPADRRRVDLDDDVGRVQDVGSGTVSQALRPGPW